MTENDILTLIVAVVVGAVVLTESERRLPAWAATILGALAAIAAGLITQAVLA